MKNKKCPKCGRFFTCTMSINCWCMVTDVPQIVKDHMAKHYQDCLCADCISELKEYFLTQNKAYE